MENSMDVLDWLVDLVGYSEAKHAEFNRH